MKKYIKLIITTLCLTFILIGFTCKSNASGVLSGMEAGVQAGQSVLPGQETSSGKKSLSSILDNPDAYASTTGEDEEVIKIGNIIVWLVRTIGEAIAVIMLLIIGIKYIIRKCRRKGRIQTNYVAIYIRSCTDICRFCTNKYNI